MPLTLNPPPPTPIEPVTEVLHGVPVTDPYRWLEDQNSQRTRKWLEEQTAYTQAYLNALPGRDRIRERIEELLAVGVVSEPWKVRDRYFFLKRNAHQEQPTIVMQESETGEAVVLVDPSGIDSAGKTAVNILKISRDAKLLAYSVRRSGEDFCSISFFDVERRQSLPDRLPRGLCCGVEFATDGRGFYYSHEAVGMPRPYYRAVFWHSFGAPNEEDRQVFYGGEDPQLRLLLIGSQYGDQLGYLKCHLKDPQKKDFVMQRLGPASLPQVIVEQHAGLFIPFILDDKVIAMTDWNAPNCRVVAIDIESPKPENWQEIVPESECRIQSLTIAGGLVFVGFVENLASRIDIFDFAGQRRGTLPLPSRGTAVLFPSRPDTDTVFHGFTSFAHPPAVMRYRTVDSKHEVWKASQVPFDSASVDVEQVSFPSKDGTRVPMFLVYKKGAGRFESLPVFLTGYGGFANCITPQFTAYATFLVERGCVFAIANLRGGAEFGEEWHLAAKRRKRQVAIDDFIAAAEWLLAEGCAAPGKIAIGGGSNAGLLVGAALTQRPDLFRAVLCLGPLLDMLRYHRFDQGNLWLDEYGSAENASDFAVLHSYSPFHQVRDGVAYPAVMLITGDADTRCNPMHALKMAARLQAATRSGHPILLDYRATWGHVPVQPLSNRIEALTDRVGFICHHLGVSV